MGVVTFNPTTFKIRYPEFAAVDDDVLQMYFDEATLYLNNTETSRVTDVGQRAILLNMIVAHIATMNGTGANEAGASDLVGRIDSATEGSVSVATKYADAVSGSMAWFVQTKYGAQYWAATAPYRTMQYIPPQGCGYGRRR